MRARRAALGALALGVFVAGGLAPMACTVHVATPATPPTDARGGHVPPDFEPARACGSWRAATGSATDADSHVSFPELDARASCFVPVRYLDGRAPSVTPVADPVPAGCGYPSPHGAPGVMGSLAMHAARYEKVATAANEAAPAPITLVCDLPADVRRAAALTNARTLSALAASFRAHGPRAEGPYPYATISTFGHGRGAHSSSALVPYRPGDPCPVLDAHELELLDVNVARAERAASAFRGGVAPVVTVSGGAVHSTLTEAFLLHYLLVCRFHVPSDAVLLDPCADHTHTNLRNTGALVVEMGGRTAYVVTDDGMQADYLEDKTAFDAIGGSIDQRALRDFGYLLGSHRRASVGMRAGFWYTPYRFWAEPETGMGSFTCVPR